VAREVFLERGSHLLSKVELELLRETACVFETILEGNMPAIYLSCSPECMLKRVEQRGRPSEAFIT
jgi:deoxyadenosine/deoxycytidine kinase